MTRSTTAREAPKSGGPVMRRRCSEYSGAAADPLDRRWPAASSRNPGPGAPGVIRSFLAQGELDPLGRTGLIGDELSLAFDL
jgi:hypothetical protein